jgi:enoyl-CoA hydratase/carnithine racemase
VSSEHAVYSRQNGPVCWLYLNRPDRRNALDDTVVDALYDSLAECTQSESVDVIVIAGRGPSFCAGADLEHLLSLSAAPAGPMPFLARIAALVCDVQACPKPVVAALHGHVVAGGLELALACDVVVAAEGTMIGDGHVRNRLLPAAGSSVRLAQRVGHSLARWLLLSGELVPAERLLQTGWLHAVVPYTDLHPAVAAVAARLGAAAGPTQRNMKRLLDEIDGLPLATALAAEQTAFEANWGSAEVTDALAAFLSRRDPVPLVGDGRGGL